MPILLHRPDARALAWNVLGALAAVLVVNGLVFGLGWTGTGGSKQSHDPPGWLVGSVWVILFVLMGVARWLLTPYRQERAWVTALLVSCLLWPLYALTTRSPFPGLLGNVETIVLAASRRRLRLARLPARGLSRDAGHRLGTARHRDDFR